MVRTMAPPFNLRLLEQDAKYGISVARNAGIEASLSSLVILLDADFNNRTRIGGCAPRAAQSKIGCFGLHGTASFHFLQFIKPLLKSPLIQMPGWIDVITSPSSSLAQAFGGHLSFLKTVFQNVGIFNPTLKGFEDIEFAYRAHKLKYPIWNCPKAISYHNHPRTLDERFSQTRDYHRMLPKVMGLFPEILGNVPDYVIFEPVMLRSNSFIMVYKKLRTRYFSSKPIRYMIRKVLNILDRIHTSKPLARGCYWQLFSLMGTWDFRKGDQNNNGGIFVQILWVSLWFPFPQDNGSRIQLHYLLRALHEKHTIHLISYLPSEDERQYFHLMSQLCDHFDVIKRDPFWRDPGKRLSSHLSLHSTGHYPRCQPRHGSKSDRGRIC